jgi:hypothetical protein
VESSSDLEEWHTVANFGRSTAIGQNYAMSGTPQSSGTTELVTLISLVPASQSGDRFYRLHVSAE